MTTNATAPSAPPYSMAATFPPFRKPRRNQLRDEPIPVRQTGMARRLAHRGAMEPEGCTREELTRAKKLYRLPVDTIKEILGTLWAFRLLGFVPADTLGMTYDQIVAVVRSAQIVSPQQ